MVDLEITGDELVVRVQGADRLWGLKSELTIPLAHIAGVRPAGEDARLGRDVFLKSVGTALPGLEVGRFHVHGKRVFMDVHDPEQAIEIGLDDERFDMLVVEVADPDTELAKLSDALQRTSEGGIDT